MNKYKKIVEELFNEIKEEFFPIKPVWLKISKNGQDYTIQAKHYGTGDIEEGIIQINTADYNELPDFKEIWINDMLVFSAMSRLQKSDLCLVGVLDEDHQKYLLKFGVHPRTDVNMKLE